MIRLLLLLVVCGVQLASAVHTHQEYFSAPATAGHAGECQDNKAGKAAKLGETWTTTGCKLATCVLRPDLNGEMTLTITEDGCPIIEAKPGCRQTGKSRNKSFPDCCPKLRCRSTTGGKVVTIPGGSSAPAAQTPTANRRGNVIQRPKPTGTRTSTSAGRRTFSSRRKVSSTRRTFPKYQGGRQ